MAQRGFGLVVAILLWSVGAYAQTVPGAVKLADIPGGPIGIACIGARPGGVPEQLLVSSYNPGNLYLVQPDGTATLLDVAGFPKNWVNIEAYPATSMGLGGWPTDVVFITFGPTVYELSPDLSSASVFVSVPGKPNTHTGITFDRTGVWNFDMILTFTDGSVYRVDPQGSVTFVANTGAFHQNPRVLPDDTARWGAFAGCVATASETTNVVFAVCPDGSVSTLASGITQPESTDVQPYQGGVSLADTGYWYFLARYETQELWAYPTDAFPPDMAGALYVPTEGYGGITRIPEPGVTEVFEASNGISYEGATFCFTPKIVDTAEVCNNGVDDDGDGLVDQDDPDCQCKVDGNLTGGNTVNIVDVQCVLLASVWALQGDPNAPLPECLGPAGLQAADLNCDGQVDVVDVTAIISFALGAPLDVSVDADGNGCIDTCQGQAPILTLTNP